MKCPNCGAALESARDVKFCPYCGSKIEIHEEQPETIAGAFHGIAKSVINEVGKQLDYQREHADEIEERNRKKKKEEDKRTFKVLIGLLVVMALLFGYIHWQAERERAESKANPTGMLPAYTETIRLA